MGRIWDMQAEIEESTPIGENGEWWHVPGIMNPADRPTRMDSTRSHVDEYSEWQNGPAYHKGDKDSWPFERKFANQKAKGPIPKEELVKKYRGMDGYAVYACDLVDLVEDEILPACSREDFNKAAAEKAVAIPLGPESLDNDISMKFSYGYCTND